MLVRDAYARAREYHLYTPTTNLRELYRCTPVLSDRELTDLPSTDRVGKISTQICGRSDTRSCSIQDRYLSYYARAQPDMYAPSLGGSMDPPISMSCLPGGAPVLEHLRVLLDSQDPVLCGGSFKPFISGTLDLCAEFRQPSTNLPVIHSIVFGRSTKPEILAFISTFNEEVTKAEFPQPGFLPHSFYHFDVESLTTYPDVPFTIEVPGHPPIELHGRNQPARIHFGFHATRFEVIIPWSTRRFRPDTLQGVFALEQSSLEVNPLWHSLFRTLKGTAVGIGLEEDVSIISRFLASFPPLDSMGPLQLKTADLQALLAFAGYNSSKTNISALNFFFTGGFIVKHWRVRCGYGLWATTDPLPPALSIYLQSEAIGVLNTVLVSLCSILLHNFITPGIAALVSRKPPGRFLAWFARFWNCVLSSCYVPTANQFSNIGDRASDPWAMLQSLATHPGSVFAVSLPLLLPPWRSTTCGGCRTDQKALDHLLSVLWPVMSDSSVPEHLRWDSDRDSLVGVLSGLPDRSATQFITPGPGCRPDSSRQKIPLLSLPTTGFLAPLRSEVRTFQVSLPSSHLLAQTTLAKLMLSYTWQHPDHVFELFRRQAAQVQKHFTDRDFAVLRPLVISYYPEAEYLPDPPSVSHFTLSKRIASSQARVKRLQRCLQCTTDFATRRRLSRKVSHARATISRAQMSLTPAVEPLPTETRTVRFVDGPDSDDSMEVLIQTVQVSQDVPSEPENPDQDTDELILTTAEWDQL